MSDLYDRIGDTYSQTRRADWRIVDRIVELLDSHPGASILDIGAGTGNYSHALAKRGFTVTALEPSNVMSRQASEDSGVTWVNGAAEELPFAAESFDAVILILCIHHFTDLRSSLREAQRVVRSGSILIFTYDPEAMDGPWIFDYFPAFRQQIRAAFPSIRTIASLFDSSYSIEEHLFPLPPDLEDAFVGAAWKQPERYLDQVFRDGTSAFRQLDSTITETGLTQLRTDLESGRWDQKYPEVRASNRYDHGYTFVVARESH